MKKAYFILALSGLLFVQLTWAQNADKTLFVLKSPDQTGVTFNNRVEDTREANLLIYESFYVGAGVAIGDLNNDGLQDIYFSGNQVGDQLYVNRGDWRFEEVSEKAGVQNRGGWSTGVTMVDVNNDGLMDIYVCKSLYDDSPQLRMNELYLNTSLPNQATPTFREAAAEYGLNNYWRSMHATFLDYDRDGDQDMFLVNQPPNPGMFSPLSGMDWRDTLFSCRLYENLGDRF